MIPNSLPLRINGKESSKLAGLALIRFVSGGVSRADMARRLGVSRAAVTKIVNDLLEMNLVREGEDGPATGGRRPVLLEMNPEKGHVLGVDIGATHLRVVLADYAAQVLNEIEIPFDVRLGPDTCLAQVDTRVRAVLNQCGYRVEDMHAVGVGVPGPVVLEKGLVMAPPIMPGWDNFPIQTHLQDLWSTDVILNNDAELGALGEWAYGVGRGVQHLLYIKVGYGVGAGLLFDGRIYHGATGSAGEIGHIAIDSNGPLCTCGSRGCLEALSSGKAIAERARELIASGKHTQLSTVSDRSDITAKDVAYAAERGDLAAQEILRQAGEHLGTALASLVNLINPQMIVIGGGVSQVGDLLLGPVRRVVKDRSLPAAAQSLRINAAVLGRRSTCMGAVVQALNLALHQTIKEMDHG